MGIIFEPQDVHGIIPKGHGASSDIQQPNTRNRQQDMFYSFGNIHICNLCGNDASLDVQSVHMSLCTIFTVKEKKNSIVEIRHIAEAQPHNV